MKRVRCLLFLVCVSLALTIGCKSEADREEEARIEAMKDAMAENFATRIRRKGVEFGIQENQRYGIQDRRLIERRGELLRREYELENEQRRLMQD